MTDPLNEIESIIIKKEKVQGKHFTPLLLLKRGEISPPFQVKRSESHLRNSKVTSILMVNGKGDIWRKHCDHPTTTAPGDGRRSQKRWEYYCPPKVNSGQGLSMPDDGDHGEAWMNWEKIIMSLKLRYILDKYTLYQIWIFLNHKGMVYQCWGSLGSRRWWPWWPWMKCWPIPTHVVPVKDQEVADSLKKQRKGHLCW